MQNIFICTTNLHALQLLTTNELECNIFHYVLKIIIFKNIACIFLCINVYKYLQTFFLYLKIILIRYYKKEKNIDYKKLCNKNRLMKEREKEKQMEKTNYFNWQKNSWLILTFSICASYMFL